MFLLFTAQIQVEEYAAKQHRINAFGQRFREEFLIPALKSNDTVIVDVSGVEGYGSSFLEEVFGGLVRSNAFTKEELGSKLSCVASDATKSCYLDRISAYMEEAWGKRK